MHSIVLVVINREEGFYGCRRFKTENKNSEHEFPEGDVHPGLSGFVWTGSCVSPLPSPL